VKGKRQWSMGNMWRWRLMHGNNPSYDTPGNINWRQDS
jgi:hypothetical protein